MRVALFLALAASGAAAAATGQHVDRPQKTNGPVRRRRGAVTRRVSETVVAARRADDLPETRMEPNPEPVPQLYNPSEEFMTPNEQMGDFMEQEFEAKAEEGILLDLPDDDAEEFDEYEDELDASMSFEYDSMSTSMSADNSSMSTSMSVDNSSMSTSYESMSQDYDDDDAVMSESVSARVRRRRRRRVTSWNRARVQQERHEDAV